MIPLRALLAATVLALASPAAAEPIIGVASVIDGDTLEIRGERIRLHGVDAPESGQICLDADERPWRCGQQAALALDDRIDGPVVCEQTDIDRYGRAIAVCYRGGADLNAWLVEQGWAVAYRQYSEDYAGLEDAAAAAGVGIWAGRFVLPWDWRQGERVLARGPSEPPSPDCAIKGNINREGERIYHVPGGRHYDRTTIDLSRGQRWFCSEAEAEAAGWRAVR